MGQMTSPPDPLPDAEKGSQKIPLPGPLSDAEKVTKVGAIVAVAIWIGLSYMLGTYFRHFENLDKTYGPLGAAIGLYLWFYLSGFAVLIGGEINFLLGKRTVRRTWRSPAEMHSQINDLNNAA